MCEEVCLLVSKGAPKLEGGPSDHRINLSRRRIEQERKRLISSFRPVAEDTMDDSLSPLFLKT